MSKGTSADDLANLVVCSYNGNVRSFVHLRKMREKNLHGVKEEYVVRGALAICEGKNEFGPASYLAYMLTEHNENDGMSKLASLSPHNSYCRYLFGTQLLGRCKTEEARRQLEIASKAGHLGARRQILRMEGKYGPFRRLIILFPSLWRMAKDPGSPNFKNFI